MEPLATSSSSKPLTFSSVALPENTRRLLSGDQVRKRLLGATLHCSTSRRSVPSEGEMSQMEEFLPSPLRQKAMNLPSGDHAGPQLCPYRRTWRDVGCETSFLIEMSQSPRCLPFQVKAI